MRKITTLLILVTSIGLCSGQENSKKAQQTKAEIEIELIRGIKLLNDYAFEISLPKTICWYEGVPDIPLRQPCVSCEIEKQSVGVERGLELPRGGNAPLVVIDGFVNNTITY